MITLATTLESVKSRKDKTVSITFGTQELMPSQAGDLFSMVDKYCYIAIKPEHFLKEEEIALESLKADYSDAGKTPSQRLRNILAVWFSQDNGGFKSFALFYDHHLEILCNHFKTKLEPR